MSKNMKAWMTCKTIYRGLSCFLRDKSQLNWRFLFQKKKVFYACSDEDGIERKTETAWAEKCT